MDYKYIEQLMERYWAGETSLEEEQKSLANAGQIKEALSAAVC